ncbi:phage baseplate plug family protein [Desulfovibrio sp.]|uniref:phage baseplate plug family protein n=1 Tax=Desulfovibrio sp. TaxID=885 RepID=UPI003AF4C7FB
MQEIPLRATGNQTLQVVLEGQNCSLRLYTRSLSDGVETLFCDLSIDQEPVFYGCPCLDGLPMPLYAWLGMTGQLVFIDMEGDEAPRWSGLGSRWKLLYMSPAEADAYREGTTL